MRQTDDNTADADESTEQAVPTAPHCDVEWWTTTVETYLTPLYRFVRARVPEDVVDDIVQDVFVSAARNLAQHDPERGSVWAWLLGITRNTIAQHYRRTGSRSLIDQHAIPFADEDGRTRDAIAEGSPLPSEICEREEFRLLARAALSTLGPRHRETLIGRYYEDLSLAELARRTDLSESAANSRLHRARRELRDAFLRLTGRTTQIQEIEQ